MIITVIVREGNKAVKSDGETFTVYTTKQRINGQANADVIRQLSRFLNVSEERIRILRGLRSRRKTVLIE